MGSDSLAIKITNFYANDGVIDSPELKELEEEFWVYKNEKASQVAEAAKDGVIDDKDNLDLLTQKDQKALRALGPKLLQARDKVIQELKKAQEQQRAEYIDSREQIISNPNAPLEQRRTAWQELRQFLSPKVNLDRDGKVTKANLNKVEELFYDKTRSPQLRALAFGILMNTTPHHSGFDDKKIAELEQEYKRFEKDYQQFIPLASKVTDSPSKAHGQFTLIHLWSTTCGPCVHELPEVIRLTNTLRSQGVKVAMYAEETGATLHEAKGLFILEGGNLAHLEVGDEVNTKLRRKVGATGGSLPVTVLLQNGKVILHRTGRVRPDDFERIEEYFK